MPSGTLITCSLLCIWHSLFMASACTSFMSGTEKRWDFICFLYSLEMKQSKFESWGFCISILTQTWMYLAVPVCLYVGERVLRFFRSGNYSVRLLKVGQKDMRTWHSLCVQLLMQHPPPPPSFRWLYILVMCWHCKCPSLLVSGTRVGNICLFNAQQCHPLNGNWYLQC